MYSADHITGSVSYNPRDRLDVQRYFKLFKAEPHAQLCEKLRIAPFKNIPPDQEMFILRPGERVLAHTFEFIGILPPGTTEMRARSSTGRNGVAVCKCAGWGDPGFIDRWTMEVECTNQELTPLLVGERYAQIIFHETGPVDKLYSEAGKYQQGSTLVDVVRNWSPEHMLPKSYKDPVAAPEEPTIAEAEAVEAEVAAYNADRERLGKLSMIQPELQDGSFWNFTDEERDHEYGPGWREEIAGKYLGGK